MNKEEVGETILGVAMLLFAGFLGKKYGEAKGKLDTFENKSDKKSNGKDTK